MTAAAATHRTDFLASDRCAFAVGGDAQIESGAAFDIRITPANRKRLRKDHLGRIGSNALSELRLHFP